jgi:four helix bundle protein
VDVTRLDGDRRTQRLAGQLLRALGSVGANIAEGYSRRSGRDRVRLYEYALGSARESRHWYVAARHVLPERVVAHRLDVLSQIIRLLLTTIPTQRHRDLAEPEVSYAAAPSNSSEPVPPAAPSNDIWTHDIPFP